MLRAIIYIFIVTFVTTAARIFAKRACKWLGRHIFRHRDDD